ncbi:unnamed protein product [Effrenium voratum]|nr:unnamed protein product [Effrenium voratum]
MSLQLVGLLHADSDSEEEEDVQPLPLPRQARPWPWVLAVTLAVCVWCLWPGWPVEHLGQETLTRAIRLGRSKPELLELQELSGCPTCGNSVPCTEGAVKPLLPVTATTTTTTVTTRTTTATSITTRTTSATTSSTTTTSTTTTVSTSSTTASTTSTSTTTSSTTATSTTITVSTSSTTTSATSTSTTSTSATSTSTTTSSATATSTTTTVSTSSTTTFTTTTTATSTTTSATNTTTTTFTTISFTDTTTTSITNTSTTTNTTTTEMTTTTTTSSVPCIRWEPCPEPGDECQWQLRTSCLPPAWYEITWAETLFTEVASSRAYRAELPPYNQRETYKPLETTSRFFLPRLEITQEEIIPDIEFYTMNGFEPSFDTTFEIATTHFLDDTLFVFFSGSSEAKYSLVLQTLTRRLPIWSPASGINDWVLNMSNVTFDGDEPYNYGYGADGERLETIRLAFGKVKMWEGPKVSETFTESRV